MFNTGEILDVVRKVEAETARKKAKKGRKKRAISPEIDNVIDEVLKKVWRVRERLYCSCAAYVD